MAEAPHSKLLTQAAREILRPLGLVQKGRSRIWLDDHGWWVTVVEFQPSGWARGSYLNVGVQWLWHEQNYWSFDAKHREESFVTYEDDVQFLPEARRLANRAAEKARELREKFSTMSHAADYLVSRCQPGCMWDLYHAAIACGLDGRASDGARFLEALQQHTASHPWQRELQVEAGALLKDDAGGASRLAMRVLEVVLRTRESLGLAPREVSLVQS